MRMLAIAALLAPAPALAAWPDDLVVSGMLEHSGGTVTPEYAREQLTAVATDLGVAIANKPITPARTLGTAGFDLSAGVTVSLLTKPVETEDGTPTGWLLASQGEDPNALMVLPTMTLRKGLPASIEVGARASWLAGSRQGVLSGYVRAAPIEGFKPLPDVSFQVGYSGYVGNPELELGVMDVTGSLGGTFAFGSFPGIRQAQWSPWIGGGILVMHGRTTLDDIDRTALWADTADEDGLVVESLELGLQPQVHAGFQVTNSTVLFRIAGAWSPSSIPTLHAGMGFMF